MSRYLVTGCAGFIGSRLAAALLDAGREVAGVDAMSQGLAAQLAWAAGTVARQ